MAKLIDRLYDAVARKGHVCLGLDTDPSYLPEKFRTVFQTSCDAVLAFNKQIIDSTLDITAVYKVQIAYYEALGLEGMRVYAETLAHLRRQGALVIADVKRGDIAKTAEMYAKAHFTGDFAADFITVNPFMGMDTLKPYYPYLENGYKGLFVLAATSNPGAPDIQGLTDKDGVTVSQRVGEMLRQEGRPFLGDCGYGSIGAVVGCTNQNETKAIRGRMPDTFFLIPGYGAQGGTAADIAVYLQNGNGGVVNASRSILLAWKKPEHTHRSPAEAAREECLAMRAQITAACR